MAIVVRNVLQHPSGRYSYRRIYPPELRQFVPGAPTEFKRSIGHREDAGFLQRYEAAAGDYEAAIQQARRLREGRFDRLDEPQVAYLGRLFERDWLHREDAARREGRDDWAARVEAGWEAHLDDFRRWYAEADAEAAQEFWGASAKRLLASQSLLLDPADDAGWNRLCLELNEAAIRVSSPSLARLAGIPVPTPAAPEAPARMKAPPVDAVPMLATFDAYSAAVGMTPGVREEWRRYVVALGAFVGHDDAARLTEMDVRSWRDLLLTEPTRTGAPRKPVTVRDKYLRAVHAMLAWAIDEGRLTRNVAASVKVRVPKAVKLRDRDFTLDEARRILAASLEPAPPRLSPGYARARRWIPWLCAYTGARVNEMSQLRGQDVERVDGIWTVLITPEAGTVKAKAARRVPIHSHLVEQGFLEVADTNGDGPLFYDPTQQRRPGEGSRHYKKVGERLATWVRQSVGIDDPGLQPNHGWRHTFKTRAFAAGIQERVTDAIQGHVATTVSRTYGSISLQTMAEAIDAMPRFQVEPVTR